MQVIRSHRTIQDIHVDEPNELPNRSTSAASIRSSWIFDRRRGMSNLSIIFFSIVTVSRQSWSRTATSGCRDFAPCANAFKWPKSFSTSCETAVHKWRVQHTPHHTGQYTRQLTTHVSHPSVVLVGNDGVVKLNYQGHQVQAILPLVRTM